MDDRRPRPDDAPPIRPEDRDRDERAGATRREFLRTTAAATAGLLIACGTDAIGMDAPDADPGLGLDGGVPATDLATSQAADLAESPDLAMPGAASPEAIAEAAGFPLGIASGDVSVSTAVLWTRYDGEAPLRLVVYRMNGDVYAEEIADLPAVPAEGGFVHVDVAALPSSTRLRYVFFEIEGGARKARSPVGRFRTAPAAIDTPKLAFGAVACTKNGRGMDAMARAGERDDLDAFLLVGDTTYNDGSTTLDQYRSRWAENFSSAGYRALRGRTSVYATWDDHEVDNNWDPELINAGKLAAATRSFFEHLPLRRVQGTPDRIWRSHVWGMTAEIFVLDCRGERKPSSRLSNDPIYISRAQMDWLKQGLSQSRARFKLIVNSVPISSFGPLFDTGSSLDNWLSYGKQRDEILSHIDDGQIAGVLWVAGDYHFASMGRVRPTGPGSTQIEVLAGPGAQTANPVQGVLLANPGDPNGQIPHIDWTSGVNNYTTFYLDPDDGSCHVVFRDGAGKVIAERRYML